MLYKMFFIGVIIFSSMGIGNVIVGDRKERIRVIALLQRGAKVMTNAIVLEGMPLADAFYAAERVWPCGFFKHLADLAVENPSLTGRMLAERGIEEKKEILQALKKQETEIFSDYIGKIAGALTVEQISDAAAVMNRQMTALGDSLAKEHAKTAKATRALCLCIGLAAAIILA